MNTIRALFIILIFGLAYFGSEAEPEHGAGKAPIVLADAVAPVESMLVDAMSLVWHCLTGQCRYS